MTNRFFGLFVTIFTIYMAVLLMNFLVRGYAMRHPEKAWARGLLFDA